VVRSHRCAQMDCSDRLALLIAFGGLIGTALIFRQTALLGEQNKKISEQIDLLAEQNRKLDFQTITAEHSDAAS